MTFVKIKKVGDTAEHKLLDPEIVDRQQNGYSERVGFELGRKLDMLPSSANARLKAEIVALHESGVTADEVAETVNEQYDLAITGGSVRSIVSQAVGYWRKMGAKSVDEKRALVLTRIDQLERLALRGYYNSMRGKKTTFVEKQIEKLKKSEKSVAALRQAIREEMESAQEEEREVDLFNTGLIEDILVTTAEKTKTYERFEENASGDVKFLNLMRSLNRDRAELWQLSHKDLREDPDAETAKLSDEERTKRIDAVIATARNNREKAMSLMAEAAPLGGFEEENNEQQTTEEIETVITGPDDL